MVHTSGNPESRKKGTLVSYRGRFMFYDDTTNTWHEAKKKFVVHDEKFEVVAGPFLTREEASAKAKEIRATKKYHDIFVGELE